MRPYPPADEPVDGQSHGGEVVDIRGERVGERGRPRSAAENSHPTFPMITSMNLASLPDPPRPDDDDPAVHAGHINVLADELARLFGLVPLAVRQQAAKAALDVVNHHLHQQPHAATAGDDL